MGSDEQIQLRCFAPEEVARIVRGFREQHGWTQETLSEITGLSVKTIRRAENGAKVSDDALRAFARAYKFEDINFLVRQMPIPTLDQITRWNDAFEREHIRLPAEHLSTGRALARFMDDLNMLCCMDSGIEDEGPARTEAAQAFDYLREYLDIKSDLTFEDRLTCERDLQERLNVLAQEGFSVVGAIRKTTIVGQSWLDKTPMPVAIGYVAIQSTPNQSRELTVKRKLEMAF